MDAKNRKIASVLDIWGKIRMAYSMVRSRAGSQMHNKSKTFDFTNILTFEDVDKGFKRLSKKKKYKDPYDTDVLIRYIESKDKKPNQLKKFIDQFKTTGTLEYFENLRKYSLDAYSAYAIPKPGKPGKYRPLLVPEPKDRLLFDSLLPTIIEVLKPFLVQRNLLGLGLIKKQRICDIVFDVHKNYINKGYHHVLILDFSSFFSLIDRNILIDKLTKDKFNRNLIEAIDLIINNQIQNGLDVEKKTKVPITKGGIPQGLTFSPLLACYYALDIDDVYIKDKKVAGFRYIDDIMILGKTPEDLIKVFNEIKIKAYELKMELHPIGEKSQLKCLHQENFTYLGVDIGIDSISINPKKLEEFIETIRRDIFPVRALSGDVSKIKKVYFDFVKGWLNHYESLVEDGNELHKKLDGLIKKYFEKDRQKRKPFYLKHKDWIVLKNNINLRNKKTSK